MAGRSTPPTSRTGRFAGLLLQQQQARTAPFASRTLLCAQPLHCPKSAHAAASLGQPICRPGKFESSRPDMTAPGRSFPTSCSNSCAATSWMSSSSLAWGCCGFLPETGSPFPSCPIIMATRHVFAGALPAITRCSAGEPVIGQVVQQLSNRLDAGEIVAAAAVQGVSALLPLDA